MTVVDFRSGGYGAVRDDYRHDDDRSGEYRADVTDSAAHGWQAEDDWDDGRFSARLDAARLSDRDSVLGRVARLTHYMGALVSVLLMVALAIWGYQLVVRDVSGVPVIRAVEGDGRIAPTEPGGELTDRGGLAVNDVAAGREAAPVDRVAIAPAGAVLDSQDVPMGELGATARAAQGASDMPVTEPMNGTIAMTDAEAARRLAEDQAAAAAAVPAVGPLEADAVSVASAVTDTAGQPTQDTAITAALAEAGAAPAVATPTRPLPRPRRIAAAAPAAAAPVEAAQPLVAEAAAEAPVAADAAPETAAPETAAPAPVAVASGAPLVQIGAFDSGAIAESEWTRISGRYGDLFAGKAPLVQEHKAGGRTFYRLRIAGFETRDAARKFCAALIEAGTDCIPAAAK